MQYSCDLDDWIQFRISVREKRRLIAAARQRGMSLSDFLRMTATEAVTRLAA